MSDEVGVIALAGYWQDLWASLGGAKGIVIALAGIAGLVICFAYTVSGIDLYFKEKYPERFHK